MPELEYSSIYEQKLLLLQSSTVYHDASSVQCSCNNAAAGQRTVYIHWHRRNDTYRIYRTREAHPLQSLSYRVVNEQNAAAACQCGVQLKVNGAYQLFGESRLFPMGVHVVASRCAS
jgi:hypothetical protein